jgi:hypothetical protein
MGTLEPAIGARMATRSDILLFRRRFVPCLLPVLQVSRILCWCSVFLPSQADSWKARVLPRRHSSFWATARKFSVESNDILQ